MTQTRAHMEAELRKAADEMNEAFMAWGDGNRAPNLTELEDVILELRRRMGEKMLGLALAGQEMNQPAVNPNCPQCGAEMRYKGQKERMIESRVGGLELERGYYYCACCKSGLFSPWTGNWSWGKGRGVRGWNGKPSI